MNCEIERVWRAPDGTEVVEKCIMPADTFVGEALACRFCAAPFAGVGAIQGEVYP
jgi:hypothetical protein